MGDPKLIAHVTPLLREAGIGRCVSIVHLHDGIPSEAHYGASAHTSFEIGSLTKTMTASLLGVDPTAVDDWCRGIKAPKSLLSESSVKASRCSKSTNGACPPGTKTASSCDNTS